jgi:general secretion pathway protein J
MHKHLSPRTVGQRRRGFTLIEVMVSLMILSVMAIMAWRGLDGIVRARDITEGSVKRTLRVQSVMAQWQADMRSVIDLRVVPALQFDGSALRLTRRYQGGVQVVVWALRNGRWVRWAGAPVASVGPIKDQWEVTKQIRGTEESSLTALKGVQQWQVYFYRNDAWSNAQSTGDKVSLAQAAAGQTDDALPMGVRTVITLGEGSGYTGSIKRDVQLAPQLNQK